MSSPNPSHITYSSEKVVWTIVAKNNGSTPYNSDVKVALSWNHPVNYLRVSSDTDGMQGVQFGDGSAVGTVFNRTTYVWNVGPLSVGQEKRLYVETSFDELQNLDNLLPLILTKTLTLDSGNIPNNVHVVSSDVLRKGVIPFPSEVDCSKVRYGPPGPPGPQGLDAYLVAVSNGYVGSLDSWLLTLVGPQGEQGPVGPPGSNIDAQNDLRKLVDGTLERGSDSFSDAKGSELLHDSYTHLNGFTFNFITGATQTTSIRLALSDNTELFRLHSDHVTNIFLGRFAGQNNIPLSTTSGQSNSAFGCSSMQSNISGYANDAFGSSALGFNTSGNTNSAFGYQSLLLNTTGNSNIGLGTDAGYSNNGSRNLYIGFHSGKTASGLITGDRNVFIGYETAQSITNASDNVMVGYFSGYNNTSGYLNTFLGSFSGFSNTTGYFNSYLASGCFEYNFTGINNSGLGFRSGQNNTSSYNTFIGSYSGQNNITGTECVSIGFESGAGESGSYKTTIGYRAGFSSTNGGVYIGYRAGDLETGANKLYIHNSNATALIGGDFSTRELKIGGVQQFSITYPTDGSGVANGSMFKGTDGALYYKGGGGTVTLIGPV